MTKTMHCQRSRSTSREPLWWWFSNFDNYNTKKQSMQIVSQLLTTKYATADNRIAVWSNCFYAVCYYFWGITDKERQITTRERTKKYISSCMLNIWTGWIPLARNQMHSIWGLHFLQRSGDPAEQSWTQSHGRLVKDTSNKHVWEPCPTTNHPVLKKWCGNDSNSLAYVLTVLLVLSVARHPTIRQALIPSTARQCTVGILLRFNNRLYRCTAPPLTGPWSSMAVVRGSRLIWSIEKHLTSAQIKVVKDQQPAHDGPPTRSRLGHPKVSAPPPTSNFLESGLVSFFLCFVPPRQIRGEILYAMYVAIHVTQQHYHPMSTAHKVTINLEPSTSTPHLKCVSHVLSQRLPLPYIYIYIYV